MSGIQDKVIAITGASGRIGQAVAKVLAGRGAKVMLGARRIGRLNALAREIVEAGGSAHYQALDVTRRASMQCFIDEANEVFGRVDVIVNNVGAMPPSMLETLEVKERDRMLDLNMHGVLHGISDSEARGRMHDDRQAAITADAIALAIASAIEQSADVDGRVRLPPARNCRLIQGSGPRCRATAG